MLLIPNQVIAFNLRMLHARFHTYIDDLKPAEFEAQPIPGLNSVAWILGHLILSHRRSLARFGVELPPLSEGFEAKFQATKQPAGVQKGLGQPAELIAMFDQLHNKLIEAVEKADSTTLNTPLSPPLPIAKTIGEAAAFTAVHIGMHSGQITAIRRALGYPPVV